MNDEILIERLGAARDRDALCDSQYYPGPWEKPGILLIPGETDAFGDPLNKSILEE